MNMVQISPDRMFSEHRAYAGISRGAAFGFVPGRDKWYACVWPLYWDQPLSAPTVMMRLVRLETHWQSDEYVNMAERNPFTVPKGLYGDLFGLMEELSYSPDCRYLMSSTYHTPSFFRETDYLKVDYLKMAMNPPVAVANGDKANRPDVFQWSQFQEPLEPNPPLYATYGTEVAARREIYGKTVERIREREREEATQEMSSRGQNSRPAFTSVPFSERANTMAELITRLSENAFVLNPPSSSMSPQERAPEKPSPVLATRRKIDI